MGGSNLFQQSSNSQGSEPLALGEAEIDFATELVVWLCHQRVITAITMRNCLLAVRRFNPAEGTRPATGAKPATGGPRR